MLGRSAALALPLVLCGPVLAQSTVLIKDTFLLAPRPHGNNGRLRDIFVHTGLNDFWTQAPGAESERWSSPSNDPKWIFSASSIDGLEWPESEPNYNGTASGQAHSAALVPFNPAAGAFSVHVDAVQFYSFPDGLKLGFTSSPVGNDNFATNSDLYLEFHGTGAWNLMSRRRAAPLIQGDITPLYRLAFGWVPMTLSYDPATRRVGGMINGETFGPVTLDFDPVITHAGFEAIADIVSYMTVNNFIVRTGSERLLTLEPAPWSGRPGQTATFSTASAESAVFWQWRRDGQPLADGPSAGGSIVTGSNTPTLVIENTGPSDVGRYDCLLVAPSGVDLTAAVTLDAGLCPADFDTNGFVNGDDFDGFTAAFEQGDPSSDFDSNSFVNGDDFDAFTLAFEAGC